MHERHEQNFFGLADEGRDAYIIATANKAKRKRTMDAAPVCVIFGLSFSFSGRRRDYSN